MAQGALQAYNMQQSYMNAPAPTSTSAEIARGIFSPGGLIAIAVIAGGVVLWWNWKGLWNTLFSPIEKGVELGKKFFEGVKDVASGGIDKLKDVGESVGDKAKDIGGGIVDTAKTAADKTKSIFTSGSDEAKSIFGDVKSGGEKAVEWIKHPGIAGHNLW